MENQNISNKRKFPPFIHFNIRPILTDENPFVIASTLILTASAVQQHYRLFVTGSAPIQLRNTLYAEFSFYFFNFIKYLELK